MIAGSLEIQMLANIARLQADMNKAASLVESSGLRMEKAAAAATKALGFVGIGLGARELISYTDRWTDLNSKLVNATGSQQAADMAMQGISQTARSTYSSLELTAGSFLRNNMTLKELGYTTQQQLDLSDALNNSMVVGGTKGQAAESVMNALSKAMATGSLRGENFNTVIASGGRTVKALADGLGVGTVELRAMADAGELSTSRVIEALISQMETLRVEADAMPATIGDSFLLIGDSVFELAGRMDQAVGASSRVAGGFVSVADAIKGVATDGEKLELVISTLTTGVEVLTVVVGGRLVGSVLAAAAAKATAIRAAVGYQAALIRLDLQAGVAARGQYTLATAAGVARGALGLLGGPAGVIGVAATAIYYFREELGLVPPDIDQMKRSIDGLATSINTLSLVQANYKHDQMLDALEKAEAGVRRFQQEITAANNMIKIFGVGGFWSEKLREYEAQLESYTGSVEEHRNVLGKLAERIIQLAGGSATLADSISDQDEVVNKLTITQRMAIQYYKDLSDETSKLRKEVDAHEKLMRTANQRIEDQIAALRQQKEASTMTARAAVIYNAVMSAGESATAAQIVEIATLNVELFDQAEALKAASDANVAYQKKVADLAAAAKKAAEDELRTYNNMIEGIQRGWADGIFGMIKGTELRFDSLWETVLDGYYRMLAEMMSKNVVDMLFGGKTASLGGIFDGIGGANSNITSALSKIPGFSQFGQNSGLSSMKDAFSYIGATDDAGNAVGFQTDMFLKGMKTMGLNIAGGYAGSKVGNRLGESIFSKEAESNIAQSIGSAVGTAVGGPWGAFIGSTLGSMVDVAAGGDGYLRQNAGFLVGNTPGADSRYTFDAKAFESGLQVTGFARREDRAQAEKTMELFRQMDATTVALTSALNGTLQVTSLAGLNQEATPGSSGTYLGGGRDADLPGQINWFFSQLADNITGLDESLLSAVRAADTAEEGIKLLSDAVDKHRKLAGLDELQIRETIRLTMEKSESEYHALIELTRLADAAGLGLEGIGFALGASVSDLERWIQRVTLANHGYESSLAAVGNELERQQRLSLGLTGLADQYRFDRLNDTEKLAHTEKQFSDTLKLAMGGDSAAAEQLRSAADAYARQAGQSDLAVGAYESIMDKVIAGLDAASKAVSSTANMLPSVTGLITQALDVGRSEQYIANLLDGLGVLDVGNKVMPGLERNVTSDAQILSYIDLINKSSESQYEAAIRIADAADAHGLAYERIYQAMGLTDSQARFFENLVADPAARGLVSNELPQPAETNEEQGAGKTQDQLAATMKELSATLAKMQKSPGDAEERRELARAARDLAAASESLLEMTRSVEVRQS